MTHDPLCELAADGGTSLLITGPTEFCFGCEKVAKVRSDERERVLEQWAAGKVQGYTSNDWILDAVRQKNYQRGQRDMLAECIAAVEVMTIETVGNSAATVDQAIAALRALLEGESNGL